MSLSAAPLHRRLLLFCVSVLTLLLVAPGTSELERLRQRLLVNEAGNLWTGSLHEGWSFGLLSCRWSPYLVGKVLRFDPVTPDDYFLAKEVLGGFHVARPLPSAWKGHPLATWMALRSAALLRYPQHGGFDVEWVAEMVEEAAAREPQNRAVWQAQELVASEVGDDQSRQSAVRQEAQGTYSDDHSALAASYLQDLFEREGLPALEARYATHHFVPDYLVLRGTDRPGSPITDDGRWRGARRTQGVAELVTAVDTVALVACLTLLFLGLPFGLTHGAAKPWLSPRFNLATAICLPLTIWLLLPIWDSFELPYCASRMGATVFASALFAVHVVPWRYRLRPLSFAALFAVAHAGLAVAAAILRHDVLIQLQAHAG